MSRPRLALFLTCLAAPAGVAQAALTAPLAAQGIEGKIGRFYDDDGWTVYRLGLRRPLVGPIGTTFHGDYFERVGDGEGAFAGLGFDVTAFQGGAPGPYVVAGVGAGMGSPHSRSFSSTWTSWSAGLGYELQPASFLRVGARVPLARDVARQAGRDGAGGGALVQLRRRREEVSEVEGDGSRGRRRRAVATTGAFLRSRRRSPPRLESARPRRGWPTRSSRPRPR